MFFNPKYSAEMKSIDERTYAGSATLIQILSGWQLNQVPFATLIRDKCRHPIALAESPYGECLSVNETCRREIKTPLRMFYGSIDEVAGPRIGLLGHDCQYRITDTTGAPSPDIHPRVRCREVLDGLLTLMQRTGPAKTPRR